MTAIDTSDLGLDLTMDLLAELPTVRMDFRTIGQTTPTKQSPPSPSPMQSCDSTYASARPSASRSAPRGWLYSLLRHPRMMPYNRLAIAVVLLNLGYLCFGGSEVGPIFAHGLNAANVLNVAFVNVVVAIIIRQPYVINLLFGLATRAPKTWPLSVRWALGKVYHFGGIHVGAFFSATMWLGLYTAMNLLSDAPSAPPHVVALSAIHVILLGVMILVALPKARAEKHNRFERTARFGTWASLALLWAQVVLLADASRDTSTLSLALIASPKTWALALATLSVALPWFYLRRVKVDVETPSSHVAIATFDYGVTPFAGSSTEISRSPLLEWHPFANIPAPNRSGFRLAISRAGDWTSKFIEDRPSHVWVKSIPTAGVGHVERLFKRVVWIATGSGVGPCVPHLLTGEVPARLVWSTKNPRQTFGDALVDEILTAEPEARIWNTGTQGKPDLVALALEAYEDFNAEAVICIANKKVTWDVVYALERRGIPAFGAIWDS